MAKQYNAQVPNNIKLPPTEDMSARAVVINLALSANVAISDDLVLENENGTIANVQSVWIDNSQNNSAFSLYLNEGAQTIRVPAGYQGYTQCICHQMINYTAISVGGGTVQISFLNVPVEAAFWAGGSITTNNGTTQNVQGVVASGASDVGVNPVLIGANNGGLNQTLLSDGSSALKVQAYNVPYGTPQVAIVASSGNVANAAAVATMPAVGGKTNYCSGFEITGGGATAAALVTATLAGILGGTLSYTFGAVAGPTLIDQPLTVQFTPPIPASAVNTAITLTLPALGAGNTNAAVTIHGFYQ